MSRSVGEGADVEGHVFAQHVVVADDKLCRLATVFEILGRTAQRGEGMHGIVATQARTILHHNMRDELCVRPQRHVRANGAKGAYVAGGVHISAVINDGGGMNRHVSAPPHMSLHPSGRSFDTALRYFSSP